MSSKARPHHTDISSAQRIYYLLIKAVFGREQIPKLTAITSRADLKLQTSLKSILQPSKVMHGRRRALKAASADDDANLEISISHLSSCSSSPERVLLPERRQSKSLRDGTKDDVYGALIDPQFPAVTPAHLFHSTLIMPGSSIGRAFPLAEQNWRVSLLHRLDFGFYCDFTSGSLQYDPSSYNLDQPSVFTNFKRLVRELVTNWDSI